MLRAIHFPDGADFKHRKLPGAIHVDFVTAAPGEPLRLWFCCPCGCGDVRQLTVGDKMKPAGNPTWHWNGSVTEPTLHPSVNLVGHWHGWLESGYWREA